MRQPPVPSNLAHLAELTAKGGNFSYLLGDFLDGFYRCPDPDKLETEPVLLADEHPDRAVLDAYLAAVAHELSSRQKWSAPDWVFGEARYLHRPYFPIQAAAIRATLLLQSPSPFRARNLFVTANALSRA